MAAHKRDEGPRGLTNLNLCHRKTSISSKVLLVLQSNVGSMNESSVLDVALLVKFDKRCDPPP